MHGNYPGATGGSISASAADCRPRQDSAEPLWFALLCRHLFGANAPKDLEYKTGRSDRTCRAWAAGDSPPPVNILLVLQRDHSIGRQVLDYVMRDSDAPWWLELQRAERIAAAIVEITKRE